VRTKQYTDRGWNLGSIQSTIDKSYTTRTGTNRATGNSTTVYYNKDGSYVIVDNGTGKVVQISNRNNPNWKPDQSIQNPYIPK
jgi:D-hexose-6-phosphate mutarotase